MSVLSLNSSMENNERRDNQNDSTTSLSKLPIKLETQISPPENVACDVLTRIFDENSDFSFNQASYETSVQSRALFNEDLNMTSGRIYPRTPIVKRAKIGRQLQSPSPSCSGQGSPRCRHKSPTNRFYSPHPPLSRDGFPNWEVNDSVRKSKSTALPAGVVINTSWLRGVTASTPDLKVDDQSDAAIEPLPPEIGRRSNRREYPVQNMRYYNFRLIHVILNCIILISGLVYLGSAVVLMIHKNTILVIMEFRVYVLSLVTLLTIAIILFVVAFSGLYFVHRGPRKTVAYAGCSLLIGAIMVFLAFLQSTTQSRIQINVELNMLSTIQSETDDNVKDIWDYFHQAFKCCGVRGYLDWCRKVNPEIYEHVAAENYLGSFACKLPESCCEDMEIKVMTSKSLSQVSCIQSLSLWNAHRIGCLNPIRAKISYFGQISRIMNFGTAAILVLTAAISMILFAYF